MGAPDRYNGHTDGVCHLRLNLLATFIRSDKGWAAHWRHCAMPYTKSGISKKWAKYKSLSY